MNPYQQCQVVCIGCGGEVIVGLTDRGKLVPLQPDPDPAGVLAVSETLEGTPRIRYLRAGGAATSREVRMVAHWDVSPACKPPRKRRNSNPAAVAEVIQLAADVR